MGRRFLLGRTVKCLIVGNLGILRHGRSRIGLPAP